MQTESGPDQIWWLASRIALPQLAGPGLRPARRKEEAIRHGRRAVELARQSIGSSGAPYYEHPSFDSLARLSKIYAQVEEPDLALDLVEELLAMPTWFSVPELREDPRYDSLRTHPRYLRLESRTAAGEIPRGSEVLTLVT